MANILVTGGAGFIGSFLVDKLIENGHSVKIFDNLEPQVHQNNIPAFLNKQAEFINGDILDYEALKKSIKDIEIIFHQVAMVGVGQSMYQIKKYVEVNSIGTANLLNILVNTNHNVKKLIVAASMSEYGEGSYKCNDCGIITPETRTEEQLKNREWELSCPKCNKKLIPTHTREDKKLESSSIYAITKKNQEEMCLNIGKMYGIPTVALRYFNVYGPRQSLNNPYTGVIAIFMSRIMNNKPPVIYEDGNQTRDFVSVHDIVNANIISMENSNANYKIFNVGSGKAISILSVAETLLKLYGKNIKPEITNKYRKGDVRHCFADISKIRNMLDYNPKIIFEKGMEELIAWSKNEDAVDGFDKATEELSEKGLL